VFGSYYPGKEVGQAFQPDKAQSQAGKPDLHAFLSCRVNTNALDSSMVSAIKSCEGSVLANGVVMVLCPLGSGRSEILLGKCATITALPRRALVVKEGRGEDQEFSTTARRRRSQARPTKGSGRPINIVTTLAGSGIAVTVATTEKVSVGPSVLGTRLKEMTFVNVYGVEKGIDSGGKLTLSESAIPPCADATL